MKNFSDTIGNRTSDLPVCSAVPQPTAPTSVLSFVLSLFKILLRPMKVERVTLEQKCGRGLECPLRESYFIQIWNELKHFSNTSQHQIL